MRLERTVQLEASAQDAWAAVAGGGWAGPVRLTVGPAEYAGALRLLDVDEDARRAGVHVQARRLGGFGGISGTLALRPAGATGAGAGDDADGDGALALEGDLQLSGEAPPKAADALISELQLRLERAAREPAPGAAAGVSPEPSLADDPAWRRRLAARAALAVAVGAAAGLAGAAWGRRRS